jgi:hypothetical protein
MRFKPALRVKFQQTGGSVFLYPDASFQKLWGLIQVRCGGLKTLKQIQSKLPTLICYRFAMDYSFSSLDTCSIFKSIQTHCTAEQLGKLLVLDCGSGIWVTCGCTRLINSMSRPPNWATARLSWALKVDHAISRFRGQRLPLLPHSTYVIFEPSYFFHFYPAACNFVVAHPWNSTQPTPASLLPRFNSGAQLCLSTPLTSVGTTVLGFDKHSAATIVSSSSLTVNVPPFEEVLW